MAQSRLEKVGTIYSRTRGLLETGALKWNDKPLWYDLYEAFPPAEEPRFDRPALNIDVKEIFYAEDKIRALLHKEIKNVGAYNLLNNTTKTFTQRFIATYNKLEQQYEGTAEPEKLFQETLELVKKENQVEREAFKEDPESLDIKSKPKEESEPLKSLNIKDLLKE